MKRIGFSHLLLFFACSLFVATTVVHAEGGKEEWTLAGFTKYRDALFIEKKSISYPSADLARVWSLVAPSEKSKYRNEVKSELRELKKSIKGYRYTEVLNEIDCKGSRIRFLQIAHLTETGYIIHSAFSSDQEWKTIYPGSLWQNIQKTVCRN
ncbi:MAG TPA: surface-adhesin E family protein [Syntrophales bacterium]|nr:surface-adhesin E family protein [Syntrophales bacterium]